MTALTTIAHEAIVRPAGELGGWVAECRACPGWFGRPEMTRPEALRHHAEHALGIIPVAVTGYEYGPRHESRPRAVYTDPLIPVVPERPAHAKQREVDVDRLMAWIIGPILLAATAGFILLVGMWPA